MLEELHEGAPGTRVALFTAKNCGGQPAEIVFAMESGEGMINPSITGVSQGDTFGPTLFRMPLELS